MKNASLILNIILLLAVGYLFVDHFSGSAKAEPAVSEAAFGPSGPLNIVYVNIDTLLTQYDYFRQKHEALAQREQKAGADLQARRQTLEKEIAEAQRKAQSGLMAPKDIQQMEQQLSLKQQQFVQEQQMLRQELMAESQALQAEIQQKIDERLAELRDERGYDYVLSYGPGTGVLMVNDSLNITSLVIEQLNAKEEVTGEE